MSRTFEKILPMATTNLEWIASDFVPDCTLIDNGSSNPLVYDYSDNSVSSDNDGAHFIPYGSHCDPDSGYIEPTGLVATLSIEPTVNTVLVYNDEFHCDGNRRDTSGLVDLDGTSSSNRSCDFSSKDSRSCDFSPSSKGSNVASKDSRSTTSPYDPYRSLQHAQQSPTPFYPTSYPTTSPPPLGSMPVADLIRLNYSLATLMNHNVLCKLIKHHNGSRYVQKQLKRVSNDEITGILGHLIFKHNQLVSLGEDIFGNYVVQILIQNGTHEHHRLLVAHLLTNNVYQLSRSFYGCRVIQKALDCLPLRNKVAMVEELSRCGPTLLKKALVCPNANHVIQKIVMMRLDMAHVQFVVDYIDANICYYAGHIFGCRIVQSIVNDYGYRYNKRMLFRMANEANLMLLSRSQYGNYVIQHMLALQYAHDDCSDVKLLLIHNVFTNIVLLSKDKYGSNVVEKCLQKANDAQRDYLLDQLLDCRKCVLSDMVKHRYANYVVQKLLVIGNAAQQIRLVRELERSVPKLKSLHYGKHIMQKIKKIKAAGAYV